MATTCIAVDTLCKLLVGWGSEWKGGGGEARSGGGGGVEAFEVEGRGGGRGVEGWLEK